MHSLVSTCTVSFISQHWIEICLSISDMIESIFALPAPGVIAVLSQLSRKHDDGMHMVLFFLMSDNVSMYASNFDLRFPLSRLSLSIMLDLVRPPVAGKESHWENNSQVSPSPFYQLNFRLPSDYISTKPDSEFRSAASSLLMYIH